MGSSLYCSWKYLRCFLNEQGPKKEFTTSWLHVSSYLELFLRIHLQKKIENYNAQKDLPGHMVCNNTLEEWISSLTNALFISQWVKMQTRHVVRECWKTLNFSQWNIFPGTKLLSYGTILWNKDVWKKKLFFPAFQYFSSWETVSKLKDVIFLSPSHSHTFKMFSNWQNSHCYFVLFPAFWKQVGLKDRKVLFENSSSISLSWTISGDKSRIELFFFS